MNLLSENGKLSKFWLWELTRPAFEDWLDNDPAPVVVIGIGSIEQHGLQDQIAAELPKLEILATSRRGATA